ncbi:hypothetical protein EUX98_g1612 [Antrodiella citrinella]|uniref:Uncharacterized protein n=1 Tax=Antrodiella citrinella TaxID=2447956 RepID=A0A4S4N3W3_9APHY|nr:hypothetical protein EUX98_g1612 [Antrodiella citrinella]
MYICTRWHAYQAAAVVALTSAVELVLVVRIYALFNRRKIIIIPILVLWLIETTGMVISMVFAVPRMQFFGPCMIAYATPVLMGYWMSALAFESILFCLTIIRFLQFTPFHRKQGTLLYVFIQDGTWVFIVTFILMLINGIAIHTHLHTHLHAPLSGVCYQWAVSGFSCAGSTMLLNLRRFAHHHTNPDSTSDFANATHPPRCAQQPYGFLTTQFDVCQVPPAVEVKVKLKLPRVREGSEGTAETT